jgi:hypothetical protein
VEHPVLTLETKTELVTPRGVMKDVVLSRKQADR